jgi:hypothetical protein
MTPRRPGGLLVTRNVSPDTFPPSNVNDNSKFVEVFQHPLISHEIGRGRVRKRREKRRSIGGGSGVG